MKTFIFFFFLISHLISLSIYAQVPTNCMGLPEDLLQECINSDIPNVNYAVDEDGRVVIVTQESVANGLALKVYFRDGTQKLKLIKEFPSNYYVTEIKTSQGKIFYILRYVLADGRVRHRLSVLQADALGNWVESTLLPEIMDLGAVNKYENLTIVEDSLYVRKSSITYPVCSDPMDMNCWMRPPTITETNYKVDLSDLSQEVVASIPVTPASSQYFIAFTDEDLYRWDSFSGSSYKLWIRNYNEDGTSFTGNSRVGNYLYYSYKTLDGATHLVSVDVTEEVANPIKILTADLTGYIHFVDYEGNLDNGFEIRLGQTNLTKDRSGHVFSNDKEIIIEIDKTKADFTVGTNLKIEVFRKGKEELAEAAINYSVTQEDVLTKKIIYGFKPYSIGEVELVLTLGEDNKSKKYSIEVRDLAEKRVLIARIYPPTCNNILCYNPVSDGELLNYLQFALPFTHKIFPFDSNGQGNLNFITSLPPVQGQNDFLEDIEKVWIQMRSVQAHRAVIIVDPAYFGLMDLANQLNISNQVYGVNLGYKSLSLVSIYSPFSTLAHELAHSFYVEHSSNEGTDVPRNGLSKDELNGYDYISRTIIPRDYEEFMWSFNDFDTPGEWIHRLIYRDLVYGLGRPDNFFEYPQETKSLLIAAKLSSNYTINEMNISESDSTWVNSSDSNGDISVVGLNKQNEILYETKIKADFNVSARFIDEPSAQNALTSEYFPLLVAMPKIQGIEKVQIVHENQIIFEKEILRNLTLTQAVGLLPEDSFLKHPPQSRDKLLRIANEALENIQRNRKDKALNLLDKLLAESNKLLKTSYQTQGEEVGHDEFYATIEKHKRMLE